MAQAFRPKVAAMSPPPNAEDTGVDAVAREPFVGQSAQRMLQIDQGNPSRLGDGANRGVEARDLEARSLTVATFGDRRDQGHDTVRQRLIDEPGVAAGKGR